MGIELSVTPGSDTVPVDGGEVTCEARIRTDLDRSAADRPKHLALCIDSSNSMEGEKLRNAKQGIKRAVDVLDDEDHISIVEFNTSASRVLDPTQCGSNRKRIEKQVDTISAGGGTNIIAGMREARSALESQAESGLLETVLGTDDEEMLQWIVLVSDGKPSNPSHMIKSLLPTSSTLERHVSVAEEFAAAGITIQSLGVGSEYNEDIMRGVAEATRGKPEHISHSAEIEAFFRELVEEADSVVGVAPELEITPSADVSVGEVYQHEPRLNEFDPSLVGGSFTIELPAITADVAQKILIETEAPAGEDGTERRLLEAELRVGDDVTADSAVIGYRAEDDGGKLTLEDRKRIDTKARRLAVEESPGTAIDYLDDQNEAAVLEDTREHVEQLRDASGDSTEEKELKNELTKPGLTKSTGDDTASSTTDTATTTDTPSTSTPDPDSSDPSPDVDTSTERESSGTSPAVDTDPDTGPDGEATRLIPIPDVQSLAVGEPVTITVRDGSGSRASDVVVKAESVSATTDSRGRCTLTFDSPGEYTIEPTGSDGGSYDPETATVTVGRE